MLIGTLAVLGWVAFAVVQQRRAIEAPRAAAARAFRAAAVDLVEPRRTDGGTLISPR